MPNPSTDANDPPRTDHQSIDADAAAIAASIAADLTTASADRDTNEAGTGDDVEADLAAILADQLPAASNESVSAAVDVTRVRVSVTGTESDTTDDGGGDGHPRAYRLSDRLNTSQ